MSYQPTEMLPVPPMPVWNPNACSHWPMFFVDGRLPPPTPRDWEMMRATMPEQSVRAAWL